MIKRCNKKAQITIFIILAILLVGIIIVLFFLFRGSSPSNTISDFKNPQAYIDQCVRENVQKAEYLLMKQGGKIDPKDFIIDNGDKVSFACYTPSLNSPCTIQIKNNMIYQIKNETKTYLDPKIEECFNNLKSSLENNNYEVSLENSINTKVLLLPSKIIIKIQKNLVITKNGKTKRFRNFKISLPSNLYQFAKISQDNILDKISTQNNCLVSNSLFTQTGMFSVDSKNVGDSKIYTITNNLNPNEKFKFAVRHCVPPNIHV